MPFSARIYEGPWEPAFLTLFLEIFLLRKSKMCRTHFRVLKTLKVLLKNPIPKRGHLALHWWASMSKLDDSAFN